jgi:hypothetical protein
MEKRKEPRVPANQKAAITVLGEPEIHLSCRLVDVSAKGMRLALQQALEPGAALKIELDDTLLLGEVVYCRAAEEAFEAGVALEHAIFQTSELARLAARLLDPKPTKVAAT